MTSEKLRTSLNGLMNGQLEAHHFYLQGAAWAAERSLVGAQNLLLQQATSELDHMHRLFRYLTEIGAPVTFTAMREPVIAANGVKGLFEAVRDLELKVTKGFGGAYELAVAENDHATVSYLKWFIDEQHQENARCRFVLDRIDLVGNGPESLYLIDRELAALAGGKEAAAA
jgi:ferritin